MSQAVEVAFPGRVVRNDVEGGKGGREAGGDFVALQREKKGLPVVWSHLSTHDESAAFGMLLDPDEPDGFSHLWTAP